MKKVISCETTFDSAHRLMHHRGKCFNIHGHTYKLRVSISCTNPFNNMIMDFYTLKNFIKDYTDKFDHAFIYASTDYEVHKVVKAMDAIGIKKFIELPEETTVESMAELMFIELSKLLASHLSAMKELSPEVFLEEVTLWETATNSCTISGENRR